MPNIKLQAFSGLVPRTGGALLDDNQAQLARNVKLQSGELRSWRKPQAEFTPSTGAVKTVYRLHGPTAGTAWLEWNSDVDVCLSPIADVSDYRFYYTGDGGPKKSNWSLATTGSGAKPVASLQMGVPAPTTKPTLSASGGTGSVETRAYLYTYVSTFGAIKEESAPSPAELVDCNITGATVNVSGWATAPLASAGYNITAIRIYRLVTGATSVIYKLVDEIQVTPATGLVVSGSTSLNGVTLSGTTYPDTRTVAQLGVDMPSLLWGVPPADLKGLVSLPNGVLAGFTGNQVWFSEPYYPHAWPASYSLTTEFPIVGLGVFGASLIVTTSKNPYIISGTHPSAMTQEKLSMVQPCVSKRSIAYDQHGVLYAGPNGLVSIGAGAADVMTTPLYTRDEWATLNPSTMVGVIYGNYYIGFYDNGFENAAIVLSRGDIPPLTTLQFDAAGAFVDRSTGNIFAVERTENIVYQLDADVVNNTAYEWKSKKFVLPLPANFACLQVDADYGYMSDAGAIADEVAAIIAYNNALFSSFSGASLWGDLNATSAAPEGITLNTLTVNGGALKDIPTAADTRYVTVVLFRDGAQWHSVNVTSLEPVRLPADRKAYTWEVLFTGNTPMRSFVMSTSIAELKAD